MRKLRASILVAVMVAAAAAQTATEMDSEPVNRVAKKLHCSCGCNQDMACVMPPGCPMCKENKAKIFKMQQSGMNDAQILDTYVKEKGSDVLIIPPGIGGIIAPYIALALGLVLVGWTIRRYMKPRGEMATAGGLALDAAMLARIEKETNNLD